MGTPTNNYILQQPTVGGEVGTWGTNLNNNTIAPLDAILGNVFPVTITSADVNLTNTQFQNGIFNLTGGLTGNRNLFVPVGGVSTTAGAGGKFIVTNNTSNAFSVTVNTTLAGAVGSVVPQGGRSNLYCDGTNVRTADFGDATGVFVTAVSSNPTGQIPGQAGSSAVGMNTQLAYDVVNNTLYACTGTGSSATAGWTQPAQPASFTARGFDTAVNLQLSAAVAANVLTISVLTSTGATPTALNPVIIEFPDNTVANGDPVQINITGALSIATSSAGGSTFGSSNGSCLRLWILGINNSGTAVLGLTNCATLVSSIAQIFQIDEARNVTTTAMSTSANAAGTVYTSSTVGAVTGKAFRILGYLTYETPLVTAGTYNNAPDTVRLFGPGIKKPGDILQTVSAVSTSGATSGSSIFAVTPTTVTITPRSNANMISASAAGTICLNNNVVIAQAQLGRPGPVLFGAGVASVDGGGVNQANPAALMGMDAPQTRSATTYGVYIAQQSGGGVNMAWGPNSLVSGTSAIGPTYIEAREIMG